MENEEIFVVYQSKVKQAGLVIVGILMIFASLGLLFSHDGPYRIIGVIGTVFFGICELCIIKRFIDGKKLVILTSKGFYDYSSALATKGTLIPWNRVIAVKTNQIFNQTFVSVYLQAPDKVLARTSGLQRKAIRTNTAMGFGEINITLQSAKNCTYNGLIAKMNEFIDSNSDLT